MNSNSQTRPLENSPILIVAAVIVMLMTIAAVYLPDIGRGFVKDDFGWIRDARSVIAEPARLIRLTHPGFYRPLVTATFAADYLVHGGNTRGFGFTNFTLYIGCIAGIWLLLREAGVSPPAAAVGAFAWALNPHGINMAVVWLSGRTSLLLTLCSVLSAFAFLKRQRLAGSLLLFAALLSKEEATMLPFILLVWILAFRMGGERDRTLDVVAVSAPLLVYIALRAQTPAMTPASAPWFYRPTTDLLQLSSNALEYLDRGVTFFVVIVLAAWAAYRPRRIELRTPIVVAGAAWLMGGYALTVWIPVRSSLYAVFPSVGAALLCAAAVDAIRSAPAARPTGDRWLAVGLASMLALIPVYQSRNDRWVEPARLSARTIGAIAASPPAPSAGGAVVFEDENTPFASFTDAFGDFVGDAVREATHRTLAARIERGTASARGPIAARYRLTRGRVYQVDR